MSSWLVLCTDKNQIPFLESLLQRMVSQGDTSQLLITKSVLQVSDINDQPDYLISSWNMPHIDQVLFKEVFSRLKRVYYMGGKSSYFHEQFLANKIQVINCEKINSAIVAEYLMGLILLSSKGYFDAARIYRYNLGKFSYISARNKSNRFKGNFKLKIGLIGFGNISKELVKVSDSLNWTYHVYDPYVDSQEFKKFGVHQTSLRSLFEECDVVSNQLPDTVETRGLITYHHLKSMKKRAVFINTGRGKQIFRFALLKVLLLRPDLRFFLDVTAIEPLPPLSPLFFFASIQITPHIAGASPNEMERMISHLSKVHNELG